MFEHIARITEASSEACWYAGKPTRATKPPALNKPMPVRRDNQGQWQYGRRNQCSGRPVSLTGEYR